MTGTAVATRSPGELLSAINREHERVLGSARDMVQYALNCGELLIEARAAAPYGSWAVWLEENTELSVWTAQAYMKLARAEQKNAGSIKQAPSIIAALRSIYEPRKALNSGPAVDPDSAAGRLFAAAKGVGRGDDGDVVDATAVEEPPVGVEERKWNTALIHLEQQRRCMAEATQDGLTTDAVVAALTEASLAARQAAIDLEQMAASARRRQA